MRAFIDKYRGLPYEEKMLYTTKLSMVLNFFLAIGKILFGLFFGFVFCVAGTFNAFMFLAKLECFLGIKTNKRTFENRNKLISIFLFIASIVYIFYMARLVFFDVKVYDYTMFLGIGIAFISFIELGVAIYGLFKVKKAGHYYRNIKIINFCSALTAIVLTQIAILTFTGIQNVNVLNGLSGMGVGVITLLLSIFIYFAPRVSIIDKEHNKYILMKKEDNKLIDMDKKEGVIVLKKDKIHGNYQYCYSVSNDIVDGHINKTKWVWYKWNIYVQILVIVLSEILIFIYAVSRLVYYFRCLRLVKELDEMMINNGFKKEELEE